MTNSELEQIEHEVLKEKNYFSVCKKDRDVYLYTKWFALLGALVVLNYPMFVNAWDIVCPHCECTIGIHPVATKETRKWPFPDTWICSQCGYENYEGINSCAMCGGR